MRKTALAWFVLLLAVLDTPARAMTITRLLSFDSSSGWRPEAPLLEASDGNFYGTTSLGGSDGAGCAQSCVGTIFKLTPQGQFTVLHVFTGAGTPTFADGSTPKGGLVEGPDGWLYGTTYSGGAPFHSYGIIYKISKTGVFEKMHDFCPAAPCPDGANPVGSLAWGSDGNLYGTTTAPLIKPYIFRISPDGSYAAIAHFQDNPLGAPANGLLLASDGNLYGVARNGVYRVSSSGVITPLYFFGTIAQDGSNGQGPLIQGTDGNLYGTTSTGGANNNGIVFKISTSGAYAKIFDIAVATEGLYPNALWQTSDTRLWGTTSNNSAAVGGGTVYSISTSGALQEASFLNSTTGFTSIASLIQASDGKLYGTAAAGGQFGSGTVFVVDAGYPTAAGPASTLRGTVLALSPPQPNPALGGAAVTAFFNAPAGTRVTAEVYDPRGRRVRELLRDFPVSGGGRLVWDGRDEQGRIAASGAYVLRLTATTASGQHVVTRKVTLLE